MRPLLGYNVVPSLSSKYFRENEVFTFFVFSSHSMSSVHGGSLDVAELD